MKCFFVVGILIATRCVAATYYVSPTGLDTNSGTSPGAAWLTLAHVNAQTFAPGDTIYLQRGGTWNEPLIVPSSGTSGNPISFDAYGTGPAPVLTAAAPALTWTYNSGNVWTAQLPAAPASATVLNMQFGSLWGQYKAPSTTCLTAGVIVNPKDFCSYAGYVYVYDSSTTNGPAAYYGTTITPILTVATGYQLISVNNKQWLTFQHLRLQNFDSIGVLVWGASDNLVFANMEVDGMVPNSTNPLGFYISATSPASIKIFNVDAHLNYDGFKIAGTAASPSAISLVNCSAFGNRDAAIVDNVVGGSTVVTYSHVYGNSVSTLWGQDVQGVAGPNVSSTTNIGTLVNISLNFTGGTVPNYVNPQIASVGRYAAWNTFTVDDVGLAQPATGLIDGIYYRNTETYINSNVLPAFNLYGLKFNAAVTTGYAGYTSAVDRASVQNWFNQGHGINSHSWSHQYFTPAANLNAFTLLYNGTGTATISGNHLSTSVTGGTGSSIPSLDLTVAPYNQVASLVAYLNSLPGYKATQTTIRDVVHTVGLADATAQSISMGPDWVASHVYAANNIIVPTANNPSQWAFQTTGGTSGTSEPIWNSNCTTTCTDGSATWTKMQFVFDTQRMETDEMTTSKAWLNSNITGLTETYYVAPDGQESNATQGYALTAGYTGARGELSMHGVLGGAWGSDEVASKGVGLMNVISYGMAGWQTTTAAQMDAGLDSLMFRQKLWGYPVGLFIHMPDLTGSQVFQILAGLTNHGSTVKLNTELRDWMLGSWTAIPNTNPSGVYFQLSQPGAAFSAVRTVLSPDIGAGQNLGAPWNYDINGVQRTGAWDIGAYQMENATLGGGTGGGYSVLGGGNYASPCGPPTYSCADASLVAYALPAVPPQMGPNTCTAGILNQCGNSLGIGTQATDPNFNRTIYRISDASINQPTNANYTIEVTPTGSAEENLFNCSSPPTMIAIGNSGSWTYPMNFGAPTGVASSRMYTATLNATKGFVTGDAVVGWGRDCPSHAGLLYTVNGAVLKSYDFTGNTPSGTPPTASSIFDFTSSANCLGPGFTVSWSTPGGGDQFDTDFSIGFSNNGSQGGVGAIYVAVYRVGSGCRVLNLSTDAVTGDWGPTGTIPGTPCIGTIHNVKMFKIGGASGTTDISMQVRTACGVSGQIVHWHYAAASLSGSLTFSCVAAYCGGHKANGLLATINNPGDNVPNYMTLCVLNSTCGVSQLGLIPNLPSGGVQSGLDAHYGWNVLNDSWPFCGTTFDAGGTLKAWSNEVLCFNPSGGNPYRFAQTEATAANPDFSTTDVIGAVSQDGNWFMWTSDWQNTLGSTTGTATCTPGSSGNCRGDVFAVKLN